LKKLTLTVALIAFTVATGVDAGIVWRGDYSTGDRTQWSSLEGLDSRITIQQSTVRPGSGYAARVELRNGDYANSGCRNELVRETPITEGTEHYYAWSTQFDWSYPSNNTWQVFTQWHHSGLNGSPPVEMDVVGENISLTVHGDQVLWSAPLVRGVWHDFVLHVLWSSDQSVGYLELWYDGQRVMDRNHQQTVYPGQYIYLKQGLYRNASIQETAVVFHDGTVIGTTLADVAPKLVAPPPAPPPDAGSGTPGAGGTPDAGDLPDAGTVATTQQPPVEASSVGFPSGGCSSRGGAGTSGFVLAALGALFLVKRHRWR
jgi:Polysaccharide lyase